MYLHSSQFATNSHEVSDQIFYLGACWPGHRENLFCDWEKRGFDRFLTFTLSCRFNVCAFLFCSLRFQCSCTVGYSGAFCELDINECESAPCLNNGICIDGISQCVCSDGYAGGNCQVDVNVCLDSVMNYTHCLNGGMCVDGPGSNFSCRYPPGFSGKFCELDINECGSAPCLNGGLCQDHVNNYSCTCTQGKSPGIPQLTGQNDFLPHFLPAPGVVFLWKCEINFNPVGFLPVCLCQAGWELTVMWTLTSVTQCLVSMVSVSRTSLAVPTPASAALDMW
uniref:EGF-like domain-containing protein n=1 Tax=Callorhinchus milii TaxID=7868 RepID=A0A4W3JSR1_CALMI